MNGFSFPLFLRKLVVKKPIDPIINALTNIERVNKINVLKKSNISINTLSISRGSHHTA